MKTSINTGFLFYKYCMSERIIVTMTSYKGRIDNVGKVVFSILKNTKKPDKIVLNLSSDEFQNKEEDLPSDLNYLSENGLLEIFWVKENIKQFKKLIPTLERYPEDIIISIDDDIYYPDYFIETLYNDFLKYDKKSPITCANWKPPKKYYYGNLSHHGSYTLVTRKMFGDKIPLMKDLIKNHLWKELWFDDPFYTYAVLSNGYKYQLSSFNGNRYKSKIFNTIGVSNYNNDKRNKEHEFLKEIFKCNF